jgi:hypothetical protein
MSRPSLAVAVLACACALAAPASALAQDPPAEVPDIAVSEPQRVTSGPAFATAAAADNPRLWATVNICDTAKAPNSMGVRASMPGNDTRMRMYMRFHAEYWSRSLQNWAPVSGSGVSDWVYAGSAEYARRQAGWTFEFAAPPPGVTFTMRAQVEFQWRRTEEQVARIRRYKRKLRFDMKKPSARATRVARSLTRTTETGIVGVDGGDPAGTSKAMCLIY